MRRSGWAGGGAANEGRTHGDDLLACRSCRRWAVESRSRKVEVDTLSLDDCVDHGWLQRGAVLAAV